jgi:hypothetical protein
MSKFTEKEVVGLSGVGLGLDELVRQGAWQVIQQAIEAELLALLERFENVKTLHGQRAVVRNGYLLRIRRRHTRRSSPEQFPGSAKPYPR